MPLTSVPLLVYVINPVECTFPLILLSSVAEGEIKKNSHIFVAMQASMYRPAVTVAVSEKKKLARIHRILVILNINHEFNF